MRETRPSGLEGGGTELNRFSLPLSKHEVIFPRVLTCGDSTQIAVTPVTRRWVTHNKSGKTI